MGVSWKCVLAVVLMLTGCAKADPVDEAIMKHASNEGMVDLLAAGRPYSSPAEVDKVAAYLSVACLGYTLGAPESAAKMRQKMSAPTWGVELSMGQAEALHEALPTYCANRA